jgi:hypothetical protein
MVGCACTVNSGLLRRGGPRNDGARLRHCERSEAIQWTLALRHNRRGHHRGRTFALAFAYSGTTGNGQHCNQCDCCDCYFFHEHYSYNRGLQSARFVVNGLCIGIDKPHFAIIARSKATKQSRIRPYRPGLLRCARNTEASTVWGPLFRGGERMVSYWFNSNETPPVQESDR